METLYELGRRLLSANPSQPLGQPEHTLIFFREKVSSSAGRTVGQQGLDGPLKTVLLPHIGYAAVPKHANVTPQVNIPQTAPATPIICVSISIRRMFHFLAR